MELGAPKICYFWNIIIYWNGKVHFRPEHCKKYRLYRKMFQTSWAELTGRISPSTPGVELGRSKYLRFWNIIIHWNEKVHFRARRCKKYHISKNALNKSCAELNFKKLSGRISLSTTGVEPGGFKDLAIWFYQKFNFENEPILFYCFILICFLDKYYYN